MIQSSALTPQSKEIVSRLYSSNEYNKREAIYRILFDRRTDLLPELKKAVKYEKNEQIAVFMVQVSITLSTFPRDSATERRILEILQYEEGGGVNDLTSTMWKYLENCATSQMIIAILGAMGNSIPANGYDFIEMCLTNPDPEVRAMVCEKAIKSGRPTHFAYVLNLIADKDPVVSQQAFLAIKNLPDNELAIILDYALGSPDEWVLKTVAPFLPNLANNNLRPVITKVQYHSNQLVGQKAREALKLLDAIPYTTKRSMKDKAEAERRKKEEEEKQKEKEEFVIENGQKISLKEQLEQKRKEKEAEEQRIREENEALDRELAAIDPSEMEDFAKAMNNYDRLIPESKEVSIDLENMFPEEKTLIENTDFSNELANFSEIDEKLAEQTINELANKSESKPADSPATNVTKIAENIETHPNDTIATPPETTFTVKESADTLLLQKELDASIVKQNSNNDIEQSPVVSNEPAEPQENTPVLTENSDDIEKELNLNAESVNPNEINSSNELSANATDSKNDLSDDSIDLSKELSDDSLDLSKELSDDALDLSKELSDDSLDLSKELSDDELDLSKELQEVETVELENLAEPSFDLTSAAEELQKQKNNTSNNLILKQEDDVTEEMLRQLTADDLDLTITDESQQKKSAEKATEKVTKTQTTDNINKTNTPQKTATKQQVSANIKPKTTVVNVPYNAKEIFAKYPSFITDPLIEVFKATTNETKLKSLEKVLDNLTAFLNICFLQSAMYYAQESTMLTKSIKDCIKGNLIGPSAIRCLHNFVLAMKAARGNPVFFTFQLSKILGESSDTNPLMMMRELKEFLKEPEEPLSENIPQAIEGLLEILRGVRSITTNTLVMRAPQGAKQPYADLSGPTANVLAPDKMPSIDLPFGEIILISKDGSEALGLFPFFKYSKKKIIFTIPTAEELSTLYERLEITP